MNELHLTLKRRAESLGKTLRANDNIASLFQPEELEQMQDNVQQAITGLLDALCIDMENDHNTRETARRVAKMYVREMFAGRYTECPSVTDFPNISNLDEIYTLGPITVRSACSHHLVPIIGQCWVGIIPSDRLIGISKFVRVANWVMCRPQIQEEAAIMLADTLEKLIKPRGLAVIIRAQHLCMTWRGVQEVDTTMVNCILRGIFSEKSSAKQELFSILKSQGF